MRGDVFIKLSFDDFFSFRYIQWNVIIVRYERTIASTLFADPPSATYEEALKSFLEAEKLSEKEWKENRLYIAKSYLASGDTALAITWLKNAKIVACRNEMVRVYFVTEL